MGRLPKLRSLVAILFVAVAVVVVAVSYHPFEFRSDGRSSYAHEPHMRSHRVCESCTLFRVPLGSKDSAEREWFGRMRRVRQNANGSRSDRRKHENRHQQTREEESDREPRRSETSPCFAPIQPNAWKVISQKFASVSNQGWVGTSFALSLHSMCRPRIECCIVR